MNDARIRLRYLDQTINLLFPGPGEARPYTLLPHRRLPRRLVPRTWWHLGGKVMIPSGEGCIETYLREVLGTPVRVVLHVRPARRANRKPLLEVHAPDGLVAFVKIGDTDRARELIANEARTLDLLAGMPLKTVVPPAVLHYGSWRGLSVLALAPLPVRRGPIPESLLVDAIAEIARIPASRSPGLRPPSVLPASRSPGLRPPSVLPASRSPGLRPPSVQSSGPQCPGLQPPSPQAHDHRPPNPEPTESRPPLPPGPQHAGSPSRGRLFAWHGDFSPWNIARGADERLLVWDWERFGTGVPLGFDAVHHFFHRALRRTDPAAAAMACLAQALPTLAPFGLSAAEARLTAIRYLITLADRHAADGHEPLGPPARWLNPVVDHQEVLV
ncbi:hypothetical protein SAMN05216276_10413 [Streptosporangium subroseum]|uniref:Uncharacterized protein n=1 Tax=Streptosporangium subroseum TaxID=106412 RepID=A0A239MHB0_9ACTN|nr:phosphotransferase [Streptosporangium subroseum]SNT41603.1 hypothetical protein SAMN05216276_10413 [Streptosporangium subroseum]